MRNNQSENQVYKPSVLTSSLLKACLTATSPPTYSPSLASPLQTGDWLLSGLRWLFTLTTGHRCSEKACSCAHRATDSLSFIPDPRAPPHPAARCGAQGHPLLPSAQVSVGRACPVGLWGTVRPPPCGAPRPTAGRARVVARVRAPAALRHSAASPGRASPARLCRAPPAALRSPPR